MLLRALRHRNYRLYFGGQAVSLIGSWMTRVATSWLVYRLTGSALLLGLVSFVGQVPTFLLAPVGGVLVDRWNRHRVLVLTQWLSMAQSFLLAGLAISGRITVWQVLVLSLFQGLVNALDIPARQAFAVDMVEDERDLPNAIALNSSIFNGARLLGPPIAGGLIAAGGEGLCFLVDGVSYLAVIAALRAMRVRTRRTAAAPVALRRQLREGFAYAVRFAPIRTILLLVAGISLLGMPYAVLMPVVARDILHGGAHTLGFLMGAAGLGALAGGLYLASRKSVVGLGRVIALATGCFGVGLIAFGSSRALWLSLAIMSAVGFGMLVQMAASNTILQTIVDEDKRGRVMSFYAMAFMGMAPFGSLLGGVLASWIGVPRTLLLSGSACVAAAAAFACQLPQLNRAIRPIYVRKGILPEAAAGVQAAAQLSVPPEE